ncbi:alpha/beta fold hydrolase [Svornostia abyssi]|uniref:alpha/beta fold hydrolase n=1 Tax=Svornostia abyssi TaxID=2898438 RepID=UPI00338E3B0A
MAEWDPAMLALLSRERRLIMFDYPGIGKSSKLRGTVEFRGLADTTAAFITAIGLEEADVLGWSMGGFVAQQLAIRHPERVRRLILAGTNPGGDQAVLGDDDDQDTDSDPDPSDAAVIRVLYPRTKAGRAEGRAFLRRAGDRERARRDPRRLRRARRDGEAAGRRRRSLAAVERQRERAEEAAGPDARDGRQRRPRHAAGQRAAHRGAHPAREARAVPRQPRVPVRRPGAVRPGRRGVPQRAVSSSLTAHSSAASCGSRAVADGSPSRSTST